MSEIKGILYANLKPFYARGQLAIKLVFADDSATMQKVIRLSLEHEGFDLRVAGDGETAYEMVLNDKPDLIIADVYMPGLDGYELCRKIKQNFGTYGIPVVLICGEMEEYDEKLGNEVGALAHITKPFKSGEFIATIRKLLSNSKDAMDSLDSLAPEKLAMLELATPAGEGASDDGAEGETLEVLAENPEIALDDDLDLNLNDDDLLEIENALKLDSNVSPKIDWEGLDSPEAGDEMWNKTLRELNPDSEPAAVAMTPPEEPAKTVAAKREKAEPSEPALSAKEMESSFRKASKQALDDFLESRAAEIFREEMSRAIESRVKDALGERIENAFREEIAKVVSESFDRAMPRLVGMMEKITMEITPKIAEQMIKTAIDQIKGGEIN